MISNPCSWFSGGGSFGHVKEFTYEGGKYLYHFDCSGDKPTKVRTGWSGNHVSVNVVFFADSVEHARDILKRMLEFHQRCAEAQIQYYKADINSANAEEFLRGTDRSYKTCAEWLERIDEGIFTLAPTNQLYVVGWAHNDTIL